MDPALGDLTEEADQLRRRLDLAATSDSDTRQYVERLETMVDEARLPAGDELIGEIERFLRDRGAGPPELGRTSRRGPSACRPPELAGAPIPGHAGPTVWRMAQMRSTEPPKLPRHSPAVRLAQMGTRRAGESIGSPDVVRRPKDPPVFMRM